MPMGRKLRKRLAILERVRRKAERAARNRDNLEDYYGSLEQDTTLQGIKEAVNLSRPLHLRGL